MNILVGQNHLNSIGGSEAYTYSVIEELIKRGHTVDVICLNPGSLSDIIEQRFKTNVNNLRNKYDLAIISHNSVMRKMYELGIDIKSKIQVCHGTIPQLEQPCGLPGVKYVSVTKEVCDHLLGKNYPSEIIYNGIDLSRFYPTEINDKPKKVLSLSQSKAFNEQLRRYCNKLDIYFDYNNKFENPIFNIEKKIQDSDLVITLGRGAFESMACGKNVIVADWRPYQEPLMDGMITSSNIETFLENNCSGRNQRKPITEESFIDEVSKYSKEQGAKNRLFAENHFDIAEIVNKLLEVPGQQKK